jgi:hypothetical protein
MTGKIDQDIDLILPYQGLRDVICPEGKARSVSHNGFFNQRLVAPALLRILSLRIRLNRRDPGCAAFIRGTVLKGRGGRSVPL